MAEENSTLPADTFVQILLHLPTDAFVEVLLRLPTSTRRRFRLVCRRWRDLINSRTPERQVRTKILAFFSDPWHSRALVLDDGEDGPRRRHDWTYTSSLDALRMVGTSNGLICLHDSAPRPRVVRGMISSDITVANPVTGETVALLPVLVPATWGWPESYGLYSFGYHPTTGQYKVVPVRSDKAKQHDVVHVFTLGGDTAWREVALPSSATMSGSYSNPVAGVVCVDGTTYWLMAYSNEMVALDLIKDEGITSFHAWAAHRAECQVDSWVLVEIDKRPR